MPARVHAILVVRPDGRTPAAFHLRRTLAALAGQTRPVDVLTIVAVRRGRSASPRSPRRRVPSPSSRPRRRRASPRRSLSSTPRLGRRRGLAARPGHRARAATRSAGSTGVARALAVGRVRRAQAGALGRPLRDRLARRVDDARSAGRPAIADGELDQGQHDGREDVLGRGRARHPRPRRRVARRSAASTRRCAAPTKASTSACARGSPDARVALVPTAIVAVAGDGVAGLPAPLTAQRRRRRGVRRTRRRSCTAASSTRRPFAVPLHWLSILPLALWRIDRAPRRARSPASSGRSGPRPSSRSCGSAAVARARARASRAHDDAPVGAARAAAHQLVGAPGVPRRRAGRRAGAGIAAASCASSPAAAHGSCSGRSPSSVAAFPALLAWPVLGGGALQPLRTTVAPAVGGCRVRAARAGARHRSAPPTRSPPSSRVLGSLSPWEPSRAIVVLWVLALPLAALGGWFAATRVTERSGLRARGRRRLGARADAARRAHAGPSRRGHRASPAAVALLRRLGRAPLVVGGGRGIPPARRGARVARRRSLPRSWCSGRAAIVLAVVLRAGARRRAAGLVRHPRARPRRAPGLARRSQSGDGVGARRRPRRALGGPAGRRGCRGPGAPRRRASRRPTWRGGRCCCREGPTVVGAAAGRAARARSPSSAPLTQRWAAGIALLVVAGLGLATAFAAVGVAVSSRSPLPVPLWPGTGLSLAWLGALGGALVTLDAGSRPARCGSRGALAATRSCVCDRSCSPFPRSPRWPAASRFFTNGPVSTLPAYVAARGRDDPDVGTIVLTPQNAGGVSARDRVGRQRDARRAGHDRLDRARRDRPRTASSPSFAADLVTGAADDVVAELADGDQLRAARAGGRARVRCGAHDAPSASTALDQRDALDAVGDTAKGTLWRVTTDVAADRPAAPTSATASPGHRDRCEYIAVAAIALLLALPTAASRRAARRTPRVVGPHWQGGPMSDRRVFRWATTSARLLAGRLSSPWRPSRRSSTAVSVPWPTITRRAGPGVGDSRAGRIGDRLRRRAAHLGRDVADAAQIAVATPQTITSGVTAGVPSRARRCSLRRAWEQGEGALAFTAPPQDDTRTDVAASGASTVVRRRHRRLRGIRLPPAPHGVLARRRLGRDRRRRHRPALQPGRGARDGPADRRTARPARQTPPGGADVVVAAGHAAVRPARRASCSGRPQPVIRVVGRRRAGPRRRCRRASRARSRPAASTRSARCAPPSTTQTIAGVTVTTAPGDRGAPSATTVLRVLSPAAAATATVTGHRGRRRPSRRSPPQVVPLAAGSPPRSSSADCRSASTSSKSTADRPVVAAVWQTTGFDEGADFAWYTAAPLVDDAEPVRDARRAAAAAHAREPAATRRRSCR